jgi:MFS family permease
VLSLFTLLLFDSLERKNFVDLGFMSISVFPLLSSMLVAFTLVAAAYAIPWRWAATFVSVCYLVLAGIMAVFVQPATDWLLAAERLHYRDTPPFTSVVALEWFITPLVVAILIDVTMRRARHKQWSRGRLMLILALTALLAGVLPVVSIFPLLPVVLPLQLGIAGYLASVLLGFGGTYLGTLFGRNVGESIDSLER